MHASETVGAAEAFLIMSHNVDSGMPDYKRGQLLSPASTLVLARDGRSAPEGISWTGHRSGTGSGRVDADYSTTTEVADTLQREADVPFRLGHHFASDTSPLGAAIT